MQALIVDQATRVVLARGDDVRSFRVLGDLKVGLEFVFSMDDTKVAVMGHFIAPGCRCIEDTPAHLIDKYLQDRMGEMQARLALLKDGTEWREKLKSYGFMTPDIERQLDKYDLRCVFWKLVDIEPVTTFIRDLIETDFSTMTEGRYVPAP